MWEYQNFLGKLQKNIASLCIDISVLRNQSKPGTVAKCVDFCAKTDLTEFFIALKRDYKTYLDRQTGNLLEHCRSENLKFGSARKVLNIFYRHICYNGFFQREYLHDEDIYSSNSVLAALEIPIDSHVAAKLKTAKKWESIISLEPEDNDTYQSAALQNAIAQGVSRIHLDIIYWRDEIVS